MDDALVRAFEETWPAADYADAGGFRVGRGLGAGGRVSSARVAGAWCAGDIAAAEELHRAWGQPPIFRVLDDDHMLSAELGKAGYLCTTPTAIMQVQISAMTTKVIPYLTTFAVWPPLAIQRDIWAQGQIDTARVNVMDRVTCPKTAILGRIDDRAAGSAFAACCDNIVMIHAMVVLPQVRRRGLARWILGQAAIWAAEHGATRMGLAVSRANAGARAAYDRAGFTEVAGYAYYVKPS